MHTRHTIWRLADGRVSRRVPVIAILALSCAAQPARAADTFAPECLYNGPIQSLSAPVTDASNEPHVAYSADTRLYYAFRAGAAWTTEWAGLEPVLDEPIAIDLDGLDRPRIAYTRGAAVMYAYRLDGGGWLNETVFSLNGHAEDIEISAGGATHIVYVREGIDAGLMHARRVGSNWSTTKIDSGGYDASLDFDNLGRANVSYAVTRGGAVILRHAFLNGTSWAVTPIDTTTTALAPIGTSLHVDDAGDAHIAWGGGSGPNMSLRHHVVSGSAVTKETVESNGGAVNGRYPSIHAAADGTIRIAYYRDSAVGKGVRLATKSAGAWSFCYVDSGFTSTFGGGLAVDGAGTPHVAFERGAGVGVFHAVLGTPPAPPAIPDATIETVAGGPNDAGKISSMIVDASGLPHVLFFNQTISRLFYGTRTVEGWLSLALPSTWVANGETSAIVLDAAGDPHILFQRNGTLYLGEREGGAWSRSVVDAGVHGSSGDLALDAQGNDVVVYNKATSGSLYHAKRVAGVFTRTQVDSVLFGAGQSSHPSIAIDGAGVMHVSFLRWDDATPDVYVASGATPAALSSGMQLVDRAGASPPGRTSIALDPSGAPQIAYLGLDGRPWHAIEDGGEWRRTLIEASSGAAEFVSLAINSQGLPVVAFRKTSGGGAGLRVGMLDDFDGIWSTRAIDCAPGAGAFAAAALDTNDDLHATYYDANLRDLRYATDAITPAPPPTFAFDFATEVVAGAVSGAGADADMVLDAAGAPHVAFRSESASQLVYAKKAAGAWIVENVSVPNPPVGPNISLALDANNRPHILYHQDGGETIRIMRRSATSWQSSTPIAFNCDSLSSDLAIDAMGRDVLVFSDASDGSLYSATGMANNFTTNLVEANALPGPTFPSVVIDDSNTTHFSFLKRGAAGIDLYYAKGLQTALDVELVASAGGGDGAWTSIAVSASGVPQIAYQRADGTLGHAMQAAPGSWQTSVADPRVGQTRSASIALDAAGLARVAYFAAPCAGAAGLKIAKQSAIGGAWSTAYADSGSGVGGAAAVALDASGRIHAAYIDAIAVDLLYGVENDATDVAVATPPSSLPAVSLLGNAPDPFNPTTTIRYELRERAEVAIEIYDIAGRLVRTLVAPTLTAPGRHEIVWNARASGAHEIGSGIYFARLRAGNDIRVDRMTLIR
ncbi:MAG: hypothetical protein ACKVU1_13640 [bacterium]